MGERGRPRDAELRRRRKQFVELVLNGTPLKQAALDSRIQPLRGLEILDELSLVGLVEVRRRDAA